MLTQQSQGNQDGPNRTLKTYKSHPKDVSFPENQQNMVKRKRTKHFMNTFLCVAG